MFEQGVIRPPNEANSLLVRVTRNCPWNQCHICPAFKGMKFSRRDVDEIKKDIDTMWRVYEAEREFFQSAFLQDADSLSLPTDDLVEVIEYIKKRFPSISRFTTYARAKTMKRRSEVDYQRLKSAGLSRIHSGMESGSQEVLDLIKKGTTTDDIIEGGQKVVDSGISLSEYIMPGVGGLTLSESHAKETARILNIIQPDFIRVRSFALHPQSPMKRLAEQGLYTLMTDEEIIREIRLMLVHLKEIPSRLRSGDFSLNLLPGVDGYLDRDKVNMLAEIDRYLALTPDQKKVFSLLNRAYPGRWELDVLNDKQVVKDALAMIDELEQNVPNGFERHIERLKSYQIPMLQVAEWK